MDPIWTPYAGLALKTMIGTSTLAEMACSMEREAIISGENEDVLHAPTVGDVYARIAWLFPGT